MCAKFRNYSVMKNNSTCRLKFSLVPNLFSSLIKEEVFHLVENNKQLSTVFLSVAYLNNLKFSRSESIGWRNWQQRSNGPDSLAEDEEGEQRESSEGPDGTTGGSSSRESSQTADSQAGKSRSSTLTQANVNSTIRAN